MSKLNLELNINKIPEFPTKDFTFQKINNSLDKAAVEISFTGKRHILFDQPHFSLNNPYGLNKTTFESLSKNIFDKLQEYPLTSSTAFQDVPFFEKFDTTEKNQLEKYKKDIGQARQILQKITLLDQTSKKIAKKSNIITRIFFFFTQLFAKVFPANLKKAKDSLSEHEKRILKQEEQLRPFAKYHMANLTFNTTTGIMTATNLFLTMFGINDIPYLGKVLNTATMFTIAKIFYSQMKHAISMS